MLLNSIFPFCLTGKGKVDRVLISDAFCFPDPFSPGPGGDSTLGDTTTGEIMSPLGGPTSQGGAGTSSALSPTSDTEHDGILTLSYLTRALNIHACKAYFIFKFQVFVSFNFKGGILRA